MAQRFWQLWLAESCHHGDVVTPITTIHTIGMGNRFLKRGDLGIVVQVKDSELIVRFALKAVSGYDIVDVLFSRINVPNLVMVEYVENAADLQGVEFFARTTHQDATFEDPKWMNAIPYPLATTW